jgi:glycosyltransferase involved in cell wall biosynthesis
LFEEPFTIEMKNQIRLKYQIPLDSTLFIYGGNLGKPQGIDFVVDFLKAQQKQSSVYFLIVGSGTDYKKIKLWIELENPQYVKLLPELAKGDYNKLLRSSDVGMIFLDHRFTIPNFPSRLLSYLEYKLPVLAATDKCTDLGIILEKNNFGVWSESGDIQTISQNVNKLLLNPTLRAEMGVNGYRYFLNNYTVDHSYNIIIKHFGNYPG